MDKKATIGKYFYYATLIISIALLVIAFFVLNVKDIEDEEEIITRYIYRYMIIDFILFILIPIGGIVREVGDMTLVEIRNKLSIDDTLEIIEPGKLETKEFKIEKMLDSETKEEIDTINPGKLGQTVLIKIPYDIKNDWILRRKK